MTRDELATAWCRIYHDDIGFAHPDHDASVMPPCWRGYQEADLMLATDVDMSDGGRLIPDALRPMMEQMARGIVLPEERAVEYALADLRAKVEALPQPTLGLKGGVDRQAVLNLIESLVPEACR